MASPASLRGRLGLAAAFGAGVLATVTVTTVAIMLWQNTASTLADDVSLASFVASESKSPTGSDLPASGEDAFIVTFDQVGDITGSSRPLPSDLIDAIYSDVWAQTSSSEEAISVTYDGSDGGAALTVSGVACVDQSVCDTVVSGSFRPSLAAYVGPQVPFMILVVLATSVLSFLGARWLVGRSLRPVETMRAELAEITSSNLSGRVQVPDTGDELADLGQTFNETIGRLQGAVDANERFVADAAHELRSPIAGVRAAVELEASKAPGGILDDVLDELDRSSRLINDLLVLARRRGSVGPKVWSDVDLDDVARAELNAVAARFPEIAVGSTIAPARIRGDADSLRRLIANLMENACLYGATRAHVVVAADRDFCRVEVHDDGPGVSAADANRIFERFSRLDESRARATGGSGLGLAIVSEIAVEHGATVEVRLSDLGGACFVVYFAGSQP